MKRYLKICAYLSIAVALCFLSACNPVHYDTFGDVYGSILQNDNNEPIPGALVTISPGAKTYLTDDAGAFEFKELDIQQYTITVQKDGYQSNRKIVTPVAGERTEVLIFLTPKQ